jgi:hypothetical protein
MIKFIHYKKGFEPVTIRALGEKAQDFGWDLDAPLAFGDVDDRYYVLGAAEMAGPLGEGDRAIDLDGAPDDEWRVAS